jgi:hypothetical protein
VEPPKHNRGGTWVASLLSIVMLRAGILSVVLSEASFTSAVLSAPSKGPVVLTGRTEAYGMPTCRPGISSLLKKYIGGSAVSAGLDIGMVHSLLAYLPK